MKKFRGFFLKHKVVSLFRRLRRRHCSPAGGYRRLNPSTRSLSDIFKWATTIKSKAKSICYKSSGYSSLGQETQSYGAVPKGKMAVYVGRDDGDYERVLVPVIYINHPLFVQLLRKAEEVYGHDHPGGITIPCRISEFENVKTRIAAGRKILPWK